MMRTGSIDLELESRVHDRAFVGRLRELEALRAPSRTSRITAIYGRRRVGKTRLVEEAYRDRRMLTFEGIEGAGSAEQRAHFRDTLFRHSGVAAHRAASAAEWTDLLLLLAEYVGTGPCVIFCDELQWMAAGRRELVGKIKYVWDTVLSRWPGIHLILCGSVSSFLVDRVIRSSALHGRIDRVIELQPLPFSDVRSGFFGRRGTREALEAYLVFGGVPNYLEMLDERQSLRLNLATHCFEPHGYFVDELDRLFVSHFGTLRHYRSIVELLARKRLATRGAVAKHLGMTSGGRVSDLLDDLSLAGFIDAYGPVHNPGSPRLRRFRIADPFLRFYLRFIGPLRNRIKQSPAGVPLARALPDARFHVFRGLAFEHFCYQHADAIAKALGFSAVAYDYGPWYGRSDLATGAQVDLLFLRADSVITLCEVKFKERLGPEVIAEVERKVATIRARDDRSIERVLISAFAPTEELSELGYFDRVLLSEDLLG